MIDLRYVLSELRRRRSRTILTALGLGVGVGLVIAVSALSSGLDDAQEEVLAPLTGVGTDMSVNRPISTGGGDADEGLFGISDRERRRLERENGGLALDFRDLGDPGDEFTLDRFISTDISFPAREADQIADFELVERIAPSLSLTLVRVEGTVPEAGQGFGPPGGGGGPDGGPSDGGPGVTGGIDFEPLTVTGLDYSTSDLGPVTDSQVVDGKFPENRDQVLISSSFAADQGLSPSDSARAAGRRFEVAGVVQAPIGADASDVYLDLGRLQRLSEREGRINALEVRATDAAAVAPLAEAIEASFPGSEVTTAADLSARISGSLLDAQDLSSTLGTILQIVALVAAFLIVALITLSSVNKRTREIGTLKALGWRRRRVIAQISGESLLGGLLGGLVGALIGAGAAALVGTLGISLEASAETVGAFGGLAPPGFGGGSELQTEAVELSAPLDAGLILLAIGLAVLGGIVAGAVGGARAARMSPAEALRSVE